MITDGTKWCFVTQRFLRTCFNDSISMVEVHDKEHDVSDYELQVGLPKLGQD